MDSITHLFYGAAICAAIAPARHRRAALLAGAALNTLPDLDVLPLMFSDNPVVRMTWHRGATHSWLVLPFVAWALWAWFRSRGGRVTEAPVRWWWAIFVCLMAHPLIDGFTVYGTQLLWPLPVPPVMWSSLSIIDPLFTLPFVLACVVAWWARAHIAAQRALVAGIALGVAYLGWSLAAKTMVEREAAAALAARGLADAPRLSVPMPFTTWRWRVLAMTPTGHVEGLRTLSDSGPMVFASYSSDVVALHAASHIQAVQRLAWFNHGFMKAQAEDGALVLSDLRMGLEPDYTFRFGVARRDGEQWRAVTPYQPGLGIGDALALLWMRWRGDMDDEALRRELQRRRDGPQAATGKSGVTPATSESK